jgi:probable rRNA maturation factor
VDRTTDVLAFPLGETESEPAGEIVVCVPCAYREARSRGIEPLAEVVLYVVHGTLHLLGEDDGTVPRARRMRRLELGILADLGYWLPPTHLLEVK